jgi:hypothetical protein
VPEQDAPRVNAGPARRIGLRQGARVIEERAGACAWCPVSKSAAGSGNVSCGLSIAELAATKRLLFRLTAFAKSQRGNHKVRSASRRLSVFPPRS